MDGFYVTLTSNSSTSFFPGNNPSSFTVLLPQKIILSGKWSVALVELHYNYNFFNVSGGNNKIIIKYDLSQDDEMSEKDARSDDEIIEESYYMYEHAKKPEYVIGIEPGYYNSVSDVILAVNDEIHKVVEKKAVTLEINELNNRTAVQKIDDECVPASISFQGRLARQLGFDSEKNILKYKSSPYIGNAFVGVPDQMFIYTDIIEPTFLSHKRAYVLKIVNTEAKFEKFGDSCYKEFQNLHYMPVQKREFESITIDIRDDIDCFLPFCHGTLTVKLHFIKQNDAEI